VALILAESSALRVLFINDTSRNGGPGRTLLDILKFLDPTQVHRVVLLPRADIVSRRLTEAHAAEVIQFDPNLIENIYQPFSRTIERRDFDAPLLLKLLRAVGNVLRAATGLIALVRRVRRDRIDLVFCNGTSANFVGGVIAAATGIPTIWHVFYPGVGGAVRALHRRLAAGENVRSIICVSRATSLQFDHCREKVRILHDALDIDEFDARAAAPLLRAELGVGEETVIFGSLGRILPRKGFIELVRATRIVIDRLAPEQRARCRFVVLGDTPQDMQPDHLEECRALVRQLGLGEHVHFLGFRPEVRPYVADFDVSIVPSVYEDPLPRAVLESMAMSKPVIAFDVGGMGEMIEDGVEGRLLRGRPPDIEALAMACLSYFDDAEIWRRRGAAARQRIERDFDARKHAGSLQDVMLRITGSNEARA
jgi:glycosyltransferase involved in cell wall biosynthesis